MPVESTRCLTSLRARLLGAVSVALISAIAQASAQPASTDSPLAQPAPTGAPQAAGSAEPAAAVAPAEHPSPGVGAAATLGEVVVTGSRIRGVAPVGSELVSLDRKDILAAGPATTAQILQTLPQIQGLGPEAAATGAQNGAANVTRSTGLNLRGIGVDATLVLYDGQRLPAAGTQGQLVDPSVIPAIALQRIEVLPDGASAIYGSDAVAGVVNLITRQNFDGLEVSGRYGAADDYDEYQFSGLAGKKWRGGSVTFAYEHDYNSDLFGASRAFNTTNFSSHGYPDERSNQCAPGNIAAGGVNYAIPSGGVTPATSSKLVAGTSNLCDLVRDADIIPEATRDSAVLNLHQDINDNVSFYTDDFYSHRVSRLINTRTASLTVPNTNAFYTAPAGYTGASETVNYDFGQQLGEQSLPITSDSYNFLAGFKIRLPAAWRAQAWASSGRSDDVSDARTNIDNGALATYLASSNPANALNVYGSSPTSPATLAAISDGYFVIKARTALTTGNLQADGPIFTLPGGDVRLAIGTEYREEGLIGNLYTGSAVQSASSWSKVHRDVVAGYGELYIPIVGEANRLPLVRQLDLSAAGRIEHYSDFGMTGNPKVGLTWKPIDDLSVRASYGTSFRAPSLSQSSAQSSGSGLYAFPSPNAQGQLLYGIFIAGGNPALQPETATTYSVGGDWRPSFVHGLHASLTYFNVDYVNQISTLMGTPGTTSQAIYAPYLTLNPTPAQVAAVIGQYPANTPINASQVQFIFDARNHNLGTTEYQGLDYLINYDLDTPLGRLGAGVNGTYFIDINTSVVPGAPVFDGAGLINYPQRLRSRFNFSWTEGPWAAVGFVNYVGGYTNNTIAPAQHVSAWTTVDLNVSYRFADGAPFAILKGFTVSLQAQNLFDADPPFVAASPGWDAQAANAFGRILSLRLDKSW